MNKLQFWIVWCSAIFIIGGLFYFFGYWPHQTRRWCGQQTLADNLKRNPNLISDSDGRSGLNLMYGACMRKYGFEVPTL